MTTDMHGAFLEAIRADPDDDAPRLIYADWLEEQGDPDRAEFIRLQIALERNPPQGVELHEKRKRAESLLKRHREKWTGDGTCSCAFERGFPDGIWITFARHEAKPVAVLSHTLARTPVRTLHVGSPENPHAAEMLFQTPYLEAVANLPELRLIRRLRFYGWEGYNHHRGMLAVLANSPYLTGPLEVEFHEVCQLGPGGLALLLESPLAGHIETLSARGKQQCQWAEDGREERTFTRWNVGERGALAIAASSKLSRLRRLDLRWNCLGVRAAEALAQATCLKALVELRIAEAADEHHVYLDGSNDLHEVGASPLSEAAVQILRDRFGSALRLGDDPA